MRSLRGLGRGLAWATAAALVGLVLALVPAAVLDRGPNGAVRATAFPAGLVLSDPFLWYSARNSLVNAAAVTLGSLVLGVYLGRVAARWRFRGQAPLVAACLWALAVPAACSALGLRLLFAPAAPWHGAWAQFALQVGLDPHAWAWVALAWVGLAAGAPWVGLSTARALGRVAPEWEDAARLGGAGRWRVWQHVVRPLIRADVARSAALVFTLTLVEPAGPLLLGLRRTLAFQIVEAAAAPGSSSRVAILALSALAYALAVQGVLHWWGGEPPPPGDARVARRADAGPFRALVFVAFLAVGAALLWTPVLGLLGNALTPAARLSSDGARLTLAVFPELLRAPEVRRLAAHALALGLGVAAFLLALGRALGRRDDSTFVSEWPEAVPPLVLGAGASVLPDTLRLGADLISGPARSALLVMADVLDPYRTPGVLLFLAVSAVYLPRIRGRTGERRSTQYDAAIQLGASAGRSRRLASDRSRRERWGRPVLTFALAATNLAPALLLVPTDESRPVGPGLLLLCERPGDGLHRASGLAVCVVALNVAAFALAERSPSRLERPPRDPVY
jgi:ABC-type Fe3+ transport system permease subunit